MWHPVDQISPGLNAWMMLFLSLVQFKCFVLQDSNLKKILQTYSPLFTISSNTLGRNIQCPEKGTFKTKHVKVYGMNQKWDPSFLADFRCLLVPSNLGMLNFDSSPNGDGMMLKSVRP